MSKLSPRKLKPKIKLNEECDLTLDVNGVEYSGTVVFTDQDIHNNPEELGSPFYDNPYMIFPLSRPRNISIDLTARVIGQMTRVQR